MRGFCGCWDVGGKEGTGSMAQVALSFIAFCIYSRGQARLGIWHLACVYIASDSNSILIQFPLRTRILPCPPKSINTKTKNPLSQRKSGKYYIPTSTFLSIHPIMTLALRRSAHLPGIADQSNCASPSKQTNIHPSHPLSLTTSYRIIPRIAVP